jgi:hypothetical protein
MPQDTVKYPLYLKRIGAFRAAVSLSAQGVPTGTQVSLRPSQVVPSGYSTATLIPGPSTLPGRHYFSVAGSGGGKEDAAELTLVIVPVASDSTTVEPGQAGQVELGSDQQVTMTVDIPPGAFSETTTVTLALLGAAGMPTDVPPAGQVFVRTWRITSGAPLGAGQSVILTIHYEDGEVASLEEPLLQVFYWDQATQSWQSDGIHILSIDQLANIIVVQLDHFTDFALTGVVGVEQLYLPLIIR